ncbi:MgtC/SapB family protein [Candidatus Methylospira mobilis]|uniref:Protein MgtC n=2 Tax=Candidatus Methylospira mobilis TaxID=1808979 RepID=A0A5Q0BMH3_9GAMM|nr:MgtC/SapB family protein [Candidatus Methylospira mobilis]
MESINHLNLASLLDTLISLTTAFLLGGLIGLERQFRQRTAGLRTNVLVAIGASLFVDIANRVNGPAGSVHIIAYVVSGIGFLGAGAILREEGGVRGLNTAATLWCSAAVGAAAGADLIIEAVLGMLFIVTANTLLRPVVNSINSQPLSVVETEATYTVYAIADRKLKKQGAASLRSTLEMANYQVNNLAVLPFGLDEIKIEATLFSSSLNGEELSKFTQQLSEQTWVHQAYWSASPHP